MSSAIILYNISGTEPEKETQLKIFIVNKNEINAKVKQTVKSIHKEFINYIEDNNEDDELLKFYKKCLTKIKKHEELINKSGEFILDPIFSDFEENNVKNKGYNYDNTEKLYKAFNDS